MIFDLCLTDFEGSVFLFGIDEVIEYEGAEGQCDQDGFPVFVCHIGVN